MYSNFWVKNWVRLGCLGGLHNPSRKILGVWSFTNKQKNNSGARQEQKIPAMHGHETAVWYAWGHHERRGRGGGHNEVRARLQVTLPLDKQPEALEHASRRRRVGVSGVRCFDRRGSRFLLLQMVHVLCISSARALPVVPARRYLPAKSV